jgi:hypothetical protein
MIDNAKAIFGDTMTVFPSEALELDVSVDPLAGAATDEDTFDPDDGTSTSASAASAGT